MIFKMIKQTGRRHISFIVSSILIVLLILLIKGLLRSDSDYFYSLIGIVVVITILTLPFLKNYKIVGHIEILVDKIIISQDGTDSVEIQLSDSFFDYLKLIYTGFDGDQPIDALIFGGIFNRYNGVDNFIEISFKDQIIRYEIYIKSLNEFKNLISLLKQIKTSGKNIYLQKEG